MPPTLREIIEHADELARRSEEFTPSEGQYGYGDALATVHRAVLARADAERDLADAGAAAGAAGAPRVSIGSVLGTSGEAARQRYGRGAG